jgi:hypothetical protein
LFQSPARAYIEELLPDVLEGRIEPGRVFDRVARLDEVPDGYKAMNEREAIKVLIEFGQERNARMAGWTSDEFAKIGVAGKLRIALRRLDGTV